MPHWIFPGYATAVIYRIGFRFYFNFFFPELSMSRLRDGRHRRGEGHRPLGPLHATGLRPDQPKHESSRNNIFDVKYPNLDSSIVGNRKRIIVVNRLIVLNGSLVLYLN